MKTVPPFAGVARSPVLSAPVPSQQPAPTSPASSALGPRRWSFVGSRTGLRCEVACMRGCENDHSLDPSTPADPDGSPCQVESEDLYLPINAKGGAGVDAGVVVDADPDGLATVISTLKERVERLRRAHAELVEARAKWRAGR